MMREPMIAQKKSVFIAYMLGMLLAFATVSYVGFATDTLNTSSQVAAASVTQ